MVLMSCVIVVPAASVGDDTGGVLVLDATELLKEVVEYVRSATYFGLNRTSEPHHIDLYCGERQQC